MRTTIALVLALAGIWSVALAQPAPPAPTAADLAMTTTNYAGALQAAEDQRNAAQHQIAVDAGQIAVYRAIIQSQAQTITALQSAAPKPAAKAPAAPKPAK